MSDRNASSTYASFYSPEDGLNEIDFRLVFSTNWLDEDQYEYFRKKSIKCAEVLIPFCIPYDFVVSAAVYSENAKDKLMKAGFDRTIYVDPRFFF